MQQPRFFFVSFPLPKLAQFRLPMLPVLRGEGADVERAPEAGARGDDSMRCPNCIRRGEVRSVTLVAFPCYASLQR
jgi:hypothetical protein